MLLLVAAEPRLLGPSSVCVIGMTYRAEQSREGLTIPVVSVWCGVVVADFSGAGAALRAALRAALKSFVLRADEGLTALWAALRLTGEPRSPRRGRALRKRARGRSAL
jgi:hypothetical protein